MCVCVCCCVKTPGRRSQLWRYDSNKRLIHEGSTPPRDLRRYVSVEGKDFIEQEDYCSATTTVKSSVLMVLDIDDLAPRPDKLISLVVRKWDAKRNMTQSWNFTKRGRLECEAVLSAQAEALRAGASVLCGGALPSDMAPAACLQIKSECLQAGCGQLSVRVLMDGPTRVLHVREAVNHSASGEYRCGQRMTFPGFFEALLCRAISCTVNGSVPPWKVHLHSVYSDVYATAAAADACPYCGDMIMARKIFSELKQSALILLERAQLLPCDQ